MHPADFYEFARRNGELAARHLLYYDGPGLWQFAAECAQHLYERFALHVPPDHVLAILPHVNLLSEQQAQVAFAVQERAVGQ